MANTTGKKFGGRTKGTPNKVTTGMKEAILEAMEVRGKMLQGKITQEELNDLPGTTRFLLETNDPSGKNISSFMPLAGKALPLTIAGDPDAPLTHRLDEQDREILRRAGVKLDGTL